MNIHEGPPGTEAPGRMMIRLRLRYPPSVNHLWRRHPRGGMYKTEQGRDYDAHVQSASFIGYRGVRLHPRFRLSITVYPPDAHKRDLDNLAKVVMDGLAKAFGFDDAEVDTILLSRGATTRQGALDITLSDQWPSIPSGSDAPTRRAVRRPRSSAPPPASPSPASSS